MKQVYYWIGLVIFWVSVGSLAGILINMLLNELGRRFRTMWIIIEFVYYRRDFKKWIKDKERHPKCEAFNKTK